jgi:hypothetical protein
MDIEIYDTELARPLGGPRLLHFSARLPDGRRISNLTLAQVDNHSQLESNPALHPDIVHAIVAAAAARHREMSKDQRLA